MCYRMLFKIRVYIRYNKAISGQNIYLFQENALEMQVIVKTDWIAIKYAALYIMVMIKLLKHDMPITHGYKPKH